MSDWAFMRICGVTVDSWQNSYDPWYFRATDRVRHIHIPHTPLDYEHYTEGDFIGYRTTAAQLRRRLALHGFDRDSLERHFNESLALLIESIQVALLLLHERREGNELVHHLLSRAIKVLPSSTLDDWLSRIPRAISLTKGDSVEDYFNIQDHPIEEDPLLSVMLSSLPYFSDTSIAAKWHFPCQLNDFFAVAILEISDDEEICELDITELVYGERADDFTDIEEIQQGATSYFLTCCNSLNQITGLSATDTKNQVLQRMCYASIITAMEAYLGDIMKREVLNREPVKVRFVEHYKPFSSQNLKLSNIYIQLDKLDRLITEELDRIAFHNISTANQMFESVLLTKFPRQEMAELSRAVNIRHDIVHRNGKRTNGELIEVSYDEVVRLKDIVHRFTIHIDQQILDGFVTDDQ